MMRNITDIISQIRVMQEQERAEAYRCTNYLSYRTDMTPDDRLALCNWGYQVIANVSGISSFTAVKAISYFDRYMGASPECRGLEIIQLAFITSLVIALKVDSGFNVELDFVARSVTKGTYDEDEIRWMEIMILQALDWRLSGPAPHDFIDRFLGDIPGLEAMHHGFLDHISKTIAEVAMTRYSIALQYPSVIAFSAICCGLEYLNSIFAVDSLSIRQSLQHVSGINCNDSSLEVVIESMANIIFDISVNDLSSFGVRGETDNISDPSMDSPISIFQ